MSIRQQAAKGVFWSAAQNWGATLGTAIIFLVLARLLEPKAFGLLGMASACIAITEVLLRQGLGQALIQRSKLEPAHLNTAFCASLLTGILFCVLGLALAGLVAELFSEPRLAPVLRWLSLGFLIGALSNTQQAILQRRFAFKSLAIRSITAVLAGGLVGIVMALLDCGVWSLVGQSLTTGLVGAIVLWAASDWRPALAVSWTHFRELFAFGANVMGIEVLSVVIARSADLLIGFFLGTEMLGYYTIAYQLFAMITRALTQSVAAVALPTFSRLQHDLEQMRNAYSTAAQFSCLVGLPVFFGLFAVAPDLVVVLLGDKWQQSIPIVRALAFVGILQTMLYFNRPVVMACGKPAWIFRLTLLNAVAHVLAIVLVIHWGIVAVAIAFAARSYIFAPILVWMVWKLIRFSPWDGLRLIAAPSIATAALLLVVFGARYLLAGLLEPPTLLAISILLGAAVYTAVILLIAPTFTAKARELLRLVWAQPEQKT